MNHVLSPRLRQCMILARDGHTAIEIAFILGLSYRTVNQYLSDAYKRLGARNRAQAVSIAVQRGEIPPAGEGGGAPPSSSTPPAASAPSSPGHEPPPSPSA